MNSLSLALCFSFLLHLSLSAPLSLRAFPCVSSSTCRSHDFQLRGPAESDHALTLSFAVKNKNMAQLYEVLGQVSNPKSPSYGKYLSFEELGQLTVDEEAKALVLNHLTKFVEQSQVKVSKFTNFIQVNTDVKTAEKLLNGKYHTFHSKTTKKQVTRMLEFSLPEDLVKVLDYVSPTVHFPSRIGELETEQISDLSVRQNLESVLTPDSVKKFYNIPKDQVTNSKATQSLYSIDWVQGFLPEDLAAFQKYFKLSKDEATVVGKNDQELCLSNNGSACRPSTGAIEWMMAIAQKAPTTFWNVAKESGDYYVDWIESVATDRKSVV